MSRHRLLVSSLRLAVAREVAFATTAAGPVRPRLLRGVRRRSGRPHVRERPPRWRVAPNPGRELAFVDLRTRLTTASARIGTPSRGET
ncbi:hypothetical protein [Halalkalicoccus salilacus]|uniref:hypothetical protein n=1 Tax=Halalkalicoccus sp. GCM10025704 TaxID=3252662 RepID=UPI00361E1EB8